MARTRSKGAASTATTTTTTSSKPAPSIYTLPSESSNPPKLFVLPKTATPSARIVTLPNPRYNKPARYLVCPEAGFFEFTHISPPKSSPRSWLIQPTTTKTGTQHGQQQGETHVTSSPSLYLATPYDPLFLLLPALCSNTSSSQNRMFLALEDHLDGVPDEARHLGEILTCAKTRELIEARLAAVCDVVKAGEERMYRVSESKLLTEVLGKARRMASGGGGSLPGSMEERFVRRELEAPVVGLRVRQQQQQQQQNDGEGKSGSATPESAESQGSASSVETTVSLASEMSVASTAATSVADEKASDDAVVSSLAASEEVVQLQRLRVAFNFICSSYVAPGIAAMLKDSLGKATELVDFKPLDEYLARVTKLRQEAAAARSADFSRKRAADDEEEDERAEKRRKKEAEEKAKKANMSRGVKELMKVNTSGMKKMSDFFKKKA
ncbi:hypothetical protein VTI74DRAFT_6117 [Chaetomium olivicolor]